MADLVSRLNTLANHLWGLAPGARTPLADRDVRLVAHRGAHGEGAAIENTLEAFDLCFQRGVWGVELDVHLTRDLEPVIHHDPHCGRLYGRPDLAIAEVDFATLRKAVPRIPHLSEVVERYGGRMHLMLEIKESWRERKQVPDVVSRALAALEPQQDFHLLSLVPDHLEGFASIPPLAYVDVAWFNPGETIATNRELGHGAVSGSFVFLGPRRLRELRAEGKRVGTGFVETVAAMRREVARDVDWIFTDRILRLQPHVTSHSSKEP
ncbi:MAG: glycerophosphodiester phosphodiesterase [Gammaproteobacteria bacterium]|nr:MAG: glycerophosphodiester phosphodiesterase [Gammaproteobacteria bacterium]